MEKIFYPQSIAIVGLSSKQNNIPRLVLDNLVRWGYKGRLFGVNPRAEELHVGGIKMYRQIDELPIVPDLVFALIPARLVPDLVEQCGRFGVKRMAIPSGGFNEFGSAGRSLADDLVARARAYGIRFVGPNGVTVANTTNGLCLPFVPSFSPPRGGLSIITQSGGVGLMLWNQMTDENVGMAKFASIGNKLDLDEVDFLEYFGRDPETTVIAMYLESIPRGKELIEAAARIDKPVIILKSNTSAAGKKAAMSHTAAISNDDDIINTAFERGNIIRVDTFTDFLPVAKALALPPMKGRRIMLMSPAGGFTVMMADRCEELGFDLADPGEEFYEGLKQYSNAGVINFSNPLDMGDIYDANLYMDVFYRVMHNENVDGCAFVSQWPEMPRGQDVFRKMFNTDLSKETTGAILSSGKPMAVCLYGLSRTIAQIKQNINVPLFNSDEEIFTAMKKQCDYHARRAAGPFSAVEPGGIDRAAATGWMKDRRGDVGEEAMDLCAAYGIPVPLSGVAASAEEAAKMADGFGYPVVMKLVSPDALHKSDVGGVVVGVRDARAAMTAFHTIRDNLAARKKGARFEGVRVMQQAGPGYDMFIGGKRDASFGPVAFFGYGGVYIEIFKDFRNVLCPSSAQEIREKITSLKTYAILRGARGKGAGDIEGYIAAIERVTHLLAAYPAITELDLNPVRVLEDGSGVLVLDARLRIEG